MGLLSFELDKDIELVSGLVLYAVASILVNLTVVFVVFTYKATRRKV